MEVRVETQTDRSQTPTFTRSTPHNCNYENKLCNFPTSNKRRETLSILGGAPSASLLLHPVTATPPRISSSSDFSTQSFQ
ncbi:hypothetical protein CesoFtcFv8_003114 [Champsocephalus esox]|uniref:Uncharacterized protein n=1 Tax=Champsocephalus esox TaxID=159716 RepID=A0AAN8CTX2_9TELE|nr:hypothetical protein CesoFtcFv8_003114 [Champsocephalus esox]